MPFPGVTDLSAGFERYQHWKIYELGVNYGRTATRWIEARGLISLLEVKIKMMEMSHKRTGGRGIPLVLALGLFSLAHNPAGSYEWYQCTIA